ncbi:Tex family protein [Bacillus cytotoxicus]|uniref:RNA binding S1 domain protein n=2 Tax=Bacillus cytotoxicus TaxID=580165 RepID=A0AAX2CC84_9BACI|nr:MULTISPECIES: Tex family protein [Bacillus cereus group]ABS20607.1 RNA binding S1 domain protein [Bacillus cytotoxicus NVH 391-98]AWC43354.1 RNA-binding transcriptional accessory protein [Bacillus cytotoxicus]MDH2865672.1 RNA-binding transcriptional accessory protein [Bacillus cytotoxicus]MDH2885687.1 RNA-binding transcriptional accessory protein [Bacillus cytotoxicus]NZD34559.1 RNA-binding transcriptional accessory protein [Bacillus cytotoxicus]
MEMVDNRQVLMKMLVKELGFTEKQIRHVIQLTEEGNTVPFIARYRKEWTGSLDEVQIRAILDRWQYVMQLEERKEEVIRLIEEKGKLTEELHQQIIAATKLQEVEDLYRPYKEKRRTKATIAKEKGLEPLAEWLLLFSKEEPLFKAKSFINTEKKVDSAEDALQGAQDIIAEMISDDASYRTWIRNVTFKKGMISSSVKDEEKDEKNIYEMYYGYEEAIQKIVPHRVLAMNRGEKEEILKVSIVPPVEEVLRFLHKKVICDESSKSAMYVQLALEDGYKRLIQPSIEREIRKELTEVAEEQAIHIFAENLRNLLLQPPMKGKVVLAVDPAYRTGCKLAVVDDTGKVLHIDVIYPHPPVKKYDDAKQKVLSIINQYKVQMIAIGNGTASRETEEFIVDALQDVKQDVFYMIVNEAGASVYSASDLAREEFPDLQVEERSAVSIGRRLQDPLAELVKIDPKSVGVGQYQHDVSQKRLNESLTFVVETAVNQVGVNVNTASVPLLQYVSGLSKTVAKNIVVKREENGKFTNRAELKKIPRLGAKTYEQCIGFLRILEGENPLDRTSIHPEQYKNVELLLNKIGLTIQDVGTPELQKRLEGVDVSKLSSETNIGEPTLMDIIDALISPERDLRDELPKPLLKKGILKLEDLKRGMELEGTVRNVVDFGAFIDIGVKQDGLVHISKLSKQFVKHPLDIVSVGQIVKVWVDDVDMKKGRVALSMLPIE